MRVPDDLVLDRTLDYFLPSRLLKFYVGRFQPEAKPLAETYPKNFERLVPLRTTGYVFREEPGVYARFSHSLRTASLNRSQVPGRRRSQSVRTSFSIIDQSLPS